MGDYYKDARGIKYYKDQVKRKYKYEADIISDDTNINGSLHNCARTRTENITSGLESGSRICNDSRRSCSDIELQEDT